mgnify:CR=1 FL=1
MLPLAHVGFTIAAVKLMEKGLRLPQIDYRVLIIAAELPDLVDKPLASLLAGSYEYESRAFGHSLAFCGAFVLLMLIQWLWNRRLWFLPVVLGILVHQLLDAMWLHPGIFYWPLEGWQIPKPTDVFWLRYFQFGDYKIKQFDLYDNISVLILLYFFMKLALCGKVLAFFRKGKL